MSDKHLTKLEKMTDAMNSYFLKLEHHISDESFDRAYSNSDLKGRMEKLEETVNKMDRLVGYMFDRIEEIDDDINRGIKKSEEILELKKRIRRLENQLEE